VSPSRQRQFRHSRAVKRIRCHWSCPSDRYVMWNPAIGYAGSSLGIIRFEFIRCPNDFTFISSAASTHRLWRMECSGVVAWSRSPRDPVPGTAWRRLLRGFLAYYRLRKLSSESHGRAVVRWGGRERVETKSGFLDREVDVPVGDGCQNNPRAAAAVGTTHPPRNPGRFTTTLISAQGH